MASIYRNRLEYVTNLSDAILLLIVVQVYEFHKEWDKLKKTKRWISTDTIKSSQVWSSKAANQRCSLKKVFWKYAANLQENTDVEVWKRLYWNHTSAWVISCKFAAYLQNTFFKEHLWVAAYGLCRFSLLLVAVNAVSTWFTNLSWGSFI